MIAHLVSQDKLSFMCLSCAL